MLLSTTQENNWYCWFIQHISHVIINYLLSIIAKPGGKWEHLWLLGLGDIWPQIHFKTMQWKVIHGVIVVTRFRTVKVLCKQAQTKYSIKVLLQSPKEPPIELNKCDYDYVIVILSWKNVGLLLLCSAVCVSAVSKPLKISSRKKCWLDKKFG